MILLWSCWFLLISFSPAWGIVSTNVPLGNWSYHDIDRLIGMGLLDNALQGTRPYTRMQMAKLLQNSIKAYQERNQDIPPVQAIINRLKKKYLEELILLKAVDGYATKSYLKPLDTITFGYYQTDKPLNRENQYGEELGDGANYRLNFSLRGRLGDNLAFYAQPEFNSSQENDNTIDREYRALYAKFASSNFELSFGRDAIWWGPGHRGGLFFTNNSKSYEHMIKLSNPEPILLPSFLRYLGPFQFTLFSADLEKDRTISQAKYTGQRINFKPLPQLEIGLSRVYMWGGKGKENGLGEAWKVLINKGGSYEDTYNYLAGFDVTLRFYNLDRWLPLMRTITLYTEIGSDDEKRGFLNPDQLGYLAGVYCGDLFLLGRTDFRVEYAINNPGGNRFWYNHSIYQSGVRFKGRTIGHQMGTNAEELFLNATHYLTNSILLASSFSQLKQASAGNSSVTGVTRTVDQWQAGVSFLGIDRLRIQAAYLYKTEKNSSFISGEKENNHLFSLEFIGFF